MSSRSASAPTRITFHRTGVWIDSKPASSAEVAAAIAELERRLAWRSAR